jgi:hypothetical protein
MAPVEQYLMDRVAEIALARSAAPDAISHDASEIVLTRHRYETAVEGGYKNDSLSLSDREWTCPDCATYHMGDFNSAKNVKSEGLKIVAAGYPETLNACGLRVSLAEASIAG